MTSPGNGQPAGGGAVNPRTTHPSVQPRVVSRLLAPGADEAVRKKLVYTIDDRHSVLVELKLSAGRNAVEMREQFWRVFNATFEHESERPPEPLQVSSHYVRCLLTPDEITKLADQDAAEGVPPATRSIYRIWPDFR